MPKVTCPIMWTTSLLASLAFASSSSSSFIPTGHTMMMLHAPPTAFHYRGGGRKPSSSSSSAAPPLDATMVDLEDITKLQTNAKLEGLIGGAGNNIPIDVAAPLTQSSGVDYEYRDKPLMDDLRLLSDILSPILKEEDETVYNLYEEFRTLGLERAADPLDTISLQRMIEKASQLTSSQAVGVMRAFSIMLNLVNSAEVHHRTRVTKQYQRLNGTTTGVGPLPLLDDSMRGTFDALLSSGDATADQIYQQLLSQKVEIVLTAHPTQVQRKSLLRKYRQVGDYLAQLDILQSTTTAANNNDGSSLSAVSYEIFDTIQQLKGCISSIWGADEIRRLKPTPQQEAAGGNAIIESVLWDAVPAYLRKLDMQCYLSLGKRLPVDCVPIRFASWIGGDRDGNPNVTPEVTVEVILQQRLRCCRLLIADMDSLLSQLAISARFSSEMEQLANTIEHSIHQREKYRRVIGHLMDRLIITSRTMEYQLNKLKNSPHKSDHDNDVHYNQVISLLNDVSNNPTYYQSDIIDDNMARSSSAAAASRQKVKLEPIVIEKDLLEPLLIMHRSLYETGFGLVADGLLSDIIRRVGVFGMSLVPLDIREESTKHTEALDAITRWLGIGSYKEWNEEARLNWLMSELSSKRPLFPTKNVKEMTSEESVIKTLRVFDVISKMTPSSLGAYVISQAQTASDVLAVMLLQKQYGMTPFHKNMMRIVPLFETLHDLTNAPNVLETLFTIPYYVGAVNSKQEVMVGYSDSAKDAGRLAACWAQYNSQEVMSQIASKYGIELTFFHGKGGTVGRGGNPSVYRAIMSHPPNTIHGRFRVTEQGEMIQQNFGTVSIAERTLDIYTAAVCREYFAKPFAPKPSWRNEMERLSQVSCEDYRYMVREEPRFVPYFRQATPELELGALNIGSRPAKRNPKGGVESLRAIPWTFAWTQTRLHLSAWLGVGKALHTNEDQQLQTLREMYQEWPWFRETIDLIAMILSKTDFSISKNYDEQLVEKDPTQQLIQLGEEVRDKLVETRRAVLDVTQSKDVAGAHVALQRASSQIRHPYIDPVNVIQAEILKRVRRMNQKENNDAMMTEEEMKELETLKDAIIISINAIAQGMKNSG